MAKHALVLSGGGAKGREEAGAAPAIIEHYMHTSSPITILSGTSVGALNAAGIAAHDHWFPMELWRSIRAKDVFKGSRPMIPWRVWRRSSLYDSSPLWKLINKHIDPFAIRESKYRLMVHALDFFNEQQVIFTNASPDILTGIYASASVPGAFEPVSWKGTWLVDGGTVANTPIRSCIEAGAEKITIIYLNKDLPQPRIMALDVPRRYPIPRPKLGQVISGSIASMMDRHFHADLQRARDINEMVLAGMADPKYRYVDIQIYKPDRDLGDTLDFLTPAKMQQEISDAYHRAIEWLPRGSRRHQ